MNLFTGCFEHAVDGKNRVSVPRKIVETLRELGSPDEVVITVGLDRCLFLYTPAGFAGAGQAIEGSPLGEEGTREVQRNFYSSAETCGIDRSGRLLLPARAQGARGHRGQGGLRRRGPARGAVDSGRLDGAPGAHATDYEKHAKDVFR